MAEKKTGIHQPTDEPRERPDTEHSSAPTVELLRDRDAFDAARSDWERLYAADPDARFFLSWNWLSSVFDANPGRWFVLAVRSGGHEGAYCAFLPLATKTYWSSNKQAFCTELRMAGSLDWADYTGLLCDPPEDETAIPLLGQALERLGWRRLVLKNLLLSAQRESLLTEPFDADGYRLRQRSRVSKTDGTDLLVCPGVELDNSFDAYLANLVSSKSRQKIRRFLRKVENDEAYRITISSAETGERDLDAFAFLWRHKWAQRKGNDIDRLTRSYRAIIERGLLKGTVFMPLLWYGDKPVGVLCSFIDAAKRSLLFFAAGRDEQHRAVPTGLVLHAFSIRWAIGEHLCRYDFLRGNEDYKYTFGSTDTTIRYLIVSRRSRLNTRSMLDSLSSQDVRQACERYRNDGRDKRAAQGYRQLLALKSAEAPV